MNELVLEDGHSRLVLTRELDGRIRFEVNDAEHDGYAATFGAEKRQEIADFVRPVQLFPTDPVQYRRDQYDPRDCEERH